MPVHIKLHGSKAERFEAIKAELAEAFGYEPSNPEVVGILMGGFDESGDPDSPPSALSRSGQ